MRKRRLLVHVSAGALAGIAAGLVAGGGARIAMRMVADGVADGVGVRPEFTIVGSLALVIAGAIVGAPFGVIYGGVVGRFPGPWWSHGVLYGAIVLLAMGPIFFASTEEFFSRGRVAVFAALFPLYGIAVGLALAPSRRLATALPLVAQAVPAIVALAGGGLATAFLVTQALQSTRMLRM